MIDDCYAAAGHTKRTVEEKVPPPVPAVAVSCVRTGKRSVEANDVISNGFNQSSCFILRLLPAPVTWQYGLLVSELANVAGDFEKKVFREKLLLVKR